MIFTTMQPTFWPSNRIGGKLPAAGPLFRLGFQCAGRFHPNTVLSRSRFSWTRDYRPRDNVWVLCDDLICREPRSSLVSRDWGKVFSRLGGFEP